MVATIQASNLTKAFSLGEQRVYALNDVSLEVHPGEMLAIVGRPASGKSTLLHTLGCLQMPDSGRVLIEGTDSSKLQEAELERLRTYKVGFVFQAFNLLPNETVLRNVETPLRRIWSDSWETRERAEEALKIVGLGNRRDSRPGQLSMEQRQFVAIARALVHDPAVIFADEPTQALDSTAREEVMGLFQKLNDDGRTVVVATSDSGVASYCHRVVKIDEGRASDEGAVSDRRKISPARVPRQARRIQERREVMVCPRCNYGNFEEEERCERCEFPLHLTEDEQRSIEGRLSGSDSLVWCNQS